MATKITHPKHRCTTCKTKTNKSAVWQKDPETCRYCYKCCGSGSAAKNMGVPFGPPPKTKRTKK